MARPRKRLPGAKPDEARPEVTAQESIASPIIFVCLRREFPAEFKCSGWPSYPDFAAFCREARPPLSLSATEYEAMQAGDSIRYELADCFVTYLKSTRGWELLTIDQAFQLPMLPEGPWRTPATMDSAITSHTERLIRSFADDAREMYLHMYDLPGEFLAIAEGIARMDGYKTAKPSDLQDAQACLASGLQNGGWSSVDEFASWLAKMHRAEPHTVMYAVHSGRRVGAFVTLPLSERGYQRIIRGEVHERDLTSDDLHPRSGSKHVELFVLDDYAYHIPPISMSEGIAVAQMHLMLVQIAYFTRGLRPYRPVIFAVARIPQYADRLRNHGFRNVGQQIAGASAPIYVLQHPDEWGNVELSELDKAAHARWTDTLQWYQEWNHKRWERDDRILGRIALNTAAPTRGDDGLQGLVTLGLLPDLARWCIIGRLYERDGAQGADSIEKKLAELQQQGRIPSELNFQVKWTPLSRPKKCFP